MVLWLLLLAQINRPQLHIHMKNPQVTKRECQVACNLNITEHLMGWCNSCYLICYSNLNSNLNKKEGHF